jgi:hypothetical protein
MALENIGGLLTTFFCWIFGSITIFWKSWNHGDSHPQHPAKMEASMPPKRTDENDTKNFTDILVAVDRRYQSLS